MYKTEFGLVVVHIFLKTIDGRPLITGDVVAILPEGFRPQTPMDVSNMSINLANAERRAGTFVLSTNGNIGVHFDTIGANYVAGTAIFYAAQ